MFKEIWDFEKLQKVQKCGTYKIIHTFHSEIRKPQNNTHPREEL